jgi:hypothetical protein
MSAEELSDAYVRPGLPPTCLGKLGACPINNCEGLATTTLTERVYFGAAGMLLCTEAGIYCPTRQVVTADGRVYPKQQGA